MYLRFVYAGPVAGMGAREGFFQAATELAENPMSDVHVVSRVKTAMSWFADNLELPERFSKSGSKGGKFKPTKGLSWFKPTATRHISKAFELKSLLDENG